MHKQNQSSPHLVYPVQTNKRKFKQIISLMLHKYFQGLQKREQSHCDRCKIKSITILLNIFSDYIKKTLSVNKM